MNKQSEKAYGLSDLYSAISSMLNHLSFNSSLTIAVSLFDFDPDVIGDLQQVPGSDAPMLFVELVSYRGRKKPKDMNIVVNELLGQLSAGNELAFYGLSLAGHFGKFTHKSRVMYRSSLETRISDRKQAGHIHHFLNKRWC